MLFSKLFVEYTVTEVQHEKTTDNAADPAFDTDDGLRQYAEDEEAFKEFMSQVHERELYDTGVDAEYGDQLLTLSTCEYTYTNGRLVVIAKKVS